MAGGMDNVLKYLLELDASGVQGGLKGAEQAFDSFFAKMNAKNKPGAGGGAGGGGAGGHVPGLPKPEETEKGLRGLKEAEEAVEGFFSALRGGGGSLSGLATGFAGIAEAAGPLLVVAAAGIAIYEAFKLVGESVQEAVKWNLEAGKLGRQLGVTTQEASILANALEDHGVSVEAYAGAANFMTRALQNNDVGFRNLGVSVKNSDGSFRDTNVVMREVIDKLNAMPDSTEKNIIGQQVFGKSWLNSREILLITSEALEETKKQMERLGTEVTPQTEKASREYSLAMADVHDVLNAFAINLGNTVIPALTVFLKWISEEGTKVVEAFRAGLALIKPVLDEMVRAFGIASSESEEFAKTMKAHGEDGPSVFTRIAAAIRDDLVVQMRGAAIIFEYLKTLAAAFADGTSNAILSVRNAFSVLTTGRYLEGSIEAEANYQARSEARWKEYDRKVAEIRSGKSTAPVELGEMFGPNPKAKIETKDNSAKLFHQFKEELDEKKGAEENWFNWSTERELKFWLDKLDGLKKGTDAYRSVMAEATKLQMQINKDRIAADEQAIKTEIATIKAETEAAVVALREGAKRKTEASKFGAATEKQASKTGTDIALLLADEGEKNQIALEGMRQELAIEARLAKDVAAIRDKELKDFLAREEVMLQATLVRLETERAMHAVGSKEQLAIIGQEKAVRENYAKVTTAAMDKETDARVQDEREAMVRIQRLKDAAAIKEAQDLKERKKEWEGYLQPFVSGFQNGIKKILDGTLSFGDAVKGMGKMVVSAFGDMISQMVSKWISGLFTMLAQWIATKIQELLFHKTVEDQKETKTIEGATIGVAAKAAEAGAGAASSAAAVPGIGWMIAIPAAIAVVAGVMALMGGIKKAAGGFDVPAGMNPMTQLHAEEMVLPAGLANRVRGMTDPMPSAASGGGGGGSASVTLHVSTMDASSFEQSLRRHGSPLRKVLTEQIRNGKFGRVRGGRG